MLTELYTVYRTELLKYCVSLCGSIVLAEERELRGFMYH